MALAKTKQRRLVRSLPPSSTKPIETGGYGGTHPGACGTFFLRKAEQSGELHRFALAALLEAHWGGRHVPVARLAKVCIPARPPNIFMCRAVEEQATSQTYMSICTCVLQLMQVLASRGCLSRA